MFGQVLKIFMWKKWKYFLFMWKSSVLGFIIPCALIIFVLYMAQGKNPGPPTSNFFMNEYDSEFESTLTTAPSFLYAPNSSRYAFMTEFLNNEIKGYETENEMYHEMDSTPFGANVIVFQNDTKPNVLNYAMRARHYGIGSSEQSIYKRSKKSIDDEYSHSMVVLQNRINIAYIKNITNRPFPQMVLQHNPMQNVRNDTSTILLNIIKWLLVLSLLGIAPTFSVYQLVEEKQDGIKEIIAIATTYSYLNDLTHFLYGFLFLSGIGLISLAGCFFYSLFPCINPVMPILLVVLFVIALMAYSFFVSTLFDTVQFASIGGFVVYIIPLVLFELLVKSPFLVKFKVLSPCTMFLEGWTIFENYLDAQRCFSWEDLVQNEHPVKNGYSFLAILLSEILCTFFYFFLYYYISNVFPGKNGTPRSFYFLFVPSFWVTKRENHTQTPNAFVESLTASKASSVKVMGLSKHFRQFPICGKEFTAVDNISFNLPTNHITILLGHNGAGKTTTMQMITGIIPPTSGNIVVDGENDVARYRSSIGYCPQNDVFISYLNCRDHLIFFGCLRGLNFSEATGESNRLLDQVRLVDSARNAAKTLSSGMKRRLCLACAVIGQTKLVILDEPSSGLDPESRRDLWDVLLPLRKERTLLLTTHSMEEADVLGDLIIIMDHGKIVCEGTQFELKRKYGSGYTLRILMTQGFMREETMMQIQDLIPNADIRSELYPTLAVTLPYESMPEFETVLAYLEDNKERLGIDSISMSNTTMEDVFLNSAQDTVDGIIPPSYDSPESESVLMGPETMPRVQWLILKQILAIAYKKCLFIRRSWIKFLIQVMLPIIGILIAMYASSGDPSPSKKINDAHDSFEMSAKHIQNPIMILAVNSTEPFADRLVTIFEKMVADENGNAIILRNTSLFYYLLEMELRNPEQYYDKLIAAIQINGAKEKDINLRLIFQDYIAYSKAYCIHLATNMMLKFYKDDSYSIVQTNIPIKRALKDLIQIESTGAIYVFIYSFLFPFGFFFYILFYLNLPYLEETTEFRIIQKIQPLVYWMAYFMFDVILHTTLCGIYILVSTLADKFDELEGSLMRLFTLYCFVGYIYILLLYIFAKTFKKLSTIYSVLFYLLLAASIASLQFSGDHRMQENHLLIFTICRFIPEFSLRHGMDSIIVGTHGSPGAIASFPYYALASIEAVLLLVVIIVIYENIYVLTAIHDFVARITTSLCCRKNNATNYARLKKEDNYVLTENDAVASTLNNNQIQDFAVLVSALKKNYVDFPAVKDISFIVEKGQCFGLLGMNGAGKSSVFKMMTLNASITSGDIFLHGRHSKRNEKSYAQLYGYCPEMHAHLDFMTAHEILKYMAWIKGKPFSELNREADLWLKKMDLWKYKNVKVSDYSGGTKRKLNTALAMISNPLVIFLDEPTTGVDPKSRRFMWDCIKEFQKNQNTVILTSHSMDECEELCNRLAIMTTGKFECIGYIPKLKELFGTGFTLLIKVRTNCSLETLQEIKKGVQEMFHCNLRDDYAGTLIYNILEKRFIWSVVFSKLQEFCHSHSDAIEDFAINETTLEDIFLQFRRNEMTNEQV